MKRRIYLAFFAAATAALASGTADGNQSADGNRTIEVKQIVTNRDAAQRSVKIPGPSYLAKPVNRFERGEVRDDPDVIYLPKKGWVYGTE